MTGNVRDVLVVGAGPAGTATATWCARAGLDVLLIDRACFPREKACAEYLSPEAGRDLDELGVAREVEDAGASRLAGFRLVSDDGASVTGRFATSPGPPPYQPFGYAISRAVLDLLLLRKAQEHGCEVLEKTALEAAGDWDGRSREVVLRAPAGKLRVRARVVVGADGINSRLSRLLGMSRRGRLRRIALVAHLGDVEGCTDVGEMFAADGRYLGLAPLNAEAVNIAAVIPAAEAAGGGFDARAALWEEMSRWPELAQRTARARLVRRVMVAGPFASRSRSVVADGALLVGDAADFYDPFTGEGIFAALRGGKLAAAAIAAALGRGTATSSSLRGYSQARARTFAGKWLLERVVAHGATTPFIMRRFTRNLSRHPRLADLWVAAAGDSAPVSSLFAPRRILAAALPI